MADNMTREQWGRIEYLAVMLAGGFDIWGRCSDAQRDVYRKIATAVWAMLTDGESCADRMEALGISKYKKEEVDG